MIIKEIIFLNGACSPIGNRLFFGLYALRLRVNAMPYALCGMLVIGLRTVERWWGRRFQFKNELKELSNVPKIDFHDG